jgi:hypothetical protein
VVEQLRCPKEAEEHLQFLNVTRGAFFSIWSCFVIPEPRLEQVLRVWVKCDVPVEVAALSHQLREVLEKCAPGDA